MKGFCPTWFGRSLFQGHRPSYWRGMMSDNSRRFRYETVPLGLNVTGVLTVSKQMEDRPFREGYATARVDITARTKDQGKIFESFHFIAVPDGQLDSYPRLRRQLTKSLRSSLRRLAETLNRYGYGPSASPLSH